MTNVRHAGRIPYLASTARPRPFSVTCRNNDCLVMLSNTSEVVIVILDDTFELQFLLIE